MLRLAELDFHFWLARDESKPVGYAVGVRKGDTFESWGLYVLKTYRGRKIGKALKQAQIDYARQIACKQMTAVVAPTNSASIAISKSYGAQLEIHQGVHQLITNL